MPYALHKNNPVPIPDKNKPYIFYFNSSGNKSISLSLNKPLYALVPSVLRKQHCRQYTSDVSQFTELKKFLF